MSTDDTTSTTVDGTSMAFVEEDADV